MGNHGIFLQITQTTLDLITNHIDVFVALGQHMFTVFSTIFLIWEGAQVAFGGSFRANKFAALILAIAIDGAMIHFYNRPFPAVGKTFPKIVTDTGADFAAQIEESSDEAVGTKLAQAQQFIIFPVGPMVWVDLSSVIYYYGAVFLMSLAQVALLGIIAFGFVAAGCIVLVGPIFIPFFIVPGLNFLFWGWFKALLQYSFYPVIANAFAYVYGQIWLNFFEQNGFPDSGEKLAGLFLQIVVLSITFLWGMLRVPSLVSNIFAGQSGEHALPGYGWWR